MTTVQQQHAVQYRHLVVSAFRGGPLKPHFRSMDLNPSTWVKLVSPALQASCVACPRSVCSSLQSPVPTRRGCQVSYCVASPRLFHCRQCLGISTRPMRAALSVVAHQRSSFFSWKLGFSQPRPPHHSPKPLIICSLTGRNIGED